MTLLMASGAASGAGGKASSASSARYEHYLSPSSSGDEDHMADGGGLHSHRMGQQTHPDKRSKRRPNSQPNPLISPTEKCRVCREPAAKHIHYGSVTCFSCRAFFRRSIQNNAAANYTCRRNQQCDIGLKSRKTCQKCRFERCLEAGMKPSWVLSEEERERRFRKTREKKRQLQSHPQQGQAPNGVSFGQHHDDGDMESGDEDEDEAMGGCIGRPVDLATMHHAPLSPVSPPPFGMPETLQARAYMEDYRRFYKQATAAAAFDPYRPGGLVAAGAPMPPLPLPPNLVAPQSMKRAEPMVTTFVPPLYFDPPHHPQGHPQPQHHLPQPAPAHQLHHYPLPPILPPVPAASNLTMPMMERLNFAHAPAPASFPAAEIKKEPEPEPEPEPLAIPKVEMAEPAEDERHSHSGAESACAEEEMYSDSDDDDSLNKERGLVVARRLAIEPPIEISADELAQIQVIVNTHDSLYQSVPFGEELIKEMVMCSVFGIPLSTSAAMTAYRLMIQRVTKVAQGFDHFDSMPHNMQSALLKQNADLLVSLRGAVFFDDKKKGLDQILFSLGVDDVEMGKKMITTTLRSAGHMRRIDYKSFNSIQKMDQNSESEARYNRLLARVGGTVTVHPIVSKLLAYVVLFSADFTNIGNRQRVETMQDMMINMLKRFIFSQYPRAMAVHVFSSVLGSMADLRELTHIKRQRALAPPVASAGGN